MTSLADIVDVVIGVDTHKHTHTAAVVTAATCGQLDELTVATDPDGYAALVDMADRHSGLRAWAIESTGSRPDGSQTGSHGGRTLSTLHNPKHHSPSALSTPATPPTTPPFRFAGRMSGVRFPSAPPSDGAGIHTGDLASMDDDGFVFIVDRKMDMILTGGFNVYPAELERVIAGHPTVTLVAVGRHDEVKGELAKAYIVLKDGAEPDVDGIMTHCRNHFAAYEMPREIQFVAELPTTSTGKIIRRELHTLDTPGASYTRGAKPVATGLDDFSRYVISAWVVARTTARPVCDALAIAMRTHGVPDEILTE